MIGLFVILLCGILFVTYTYLIKKPTGVTPVPTVDTALQASPKNATYLIEGLPVTLVDGVSDVSAAPDSAAKIATRYFGNEAQFDFNADGRMDRVFLLTQSTGGTGTFYYAVVALNFPDGYLGSAGFFLGDRIAPQSTVVQSEGSSDIIVINYADRPDGVDFATDPTEGKTLRLSFDPTVKELSEVSSPVTPTSASNTNTSNISASNTSAMKLEQKKWQWVRTNYTDGRVFVPKKTEAFSLTFTADGKVSATTDCNGMGGTYTVSGTNLVFGALMTTLMYCDGSEEGVFGELLGQVATYSITNKGELELGLKAKAGTMIFR